jgi:hypothetical protein
MEKNMSDQLETLTPEQVAQTISAMRDSVWVINDEIAKDPPSDNKRDNIQRNVSHLELMMGKDFIINSGDNLADITAAIAAGNAALA